jgi:DNA-binding response OmpR family regulator
MSGYADESIGLKNALRPSDDYLQKPFSPVELARRVQQLLTRGNDSP